MKKSILSIILVISMMILAVGCTKKNDAGSKDDGNNTGNTNQTENQGNKETDTEEPNTEEPNQEPITILVAAAASMQPSLEELKSMFQDKYPWITVEGTYDSSGKLQTQIEEGLEADVFLSAAMKQMNTLKEENMVDEDTIIQLLENKVVLIVPENVESKVTSFDDILNAEKIAIGDPASVPAGQYAKEIFDNLGIFSKVEEKASLGTNVTEVLNWVAEGSADAGVVYATDAATTDKVVVVANAPEGTLKDPVIYPIGIVSASQKKEAAKLYVEFLQSADAKTIFEKYGFLAK
ncbi:molybdate ABC transporter substrate-binding protein [Lachnoclostridium phytofermentans]|uniref:Molybdenum ABC transporter, periplasmic molybdate-binding protein n=1 Tax=Lachnoclostridium phytofermentans (strain ATCC 700394 / DSM 18823 / ISDg) TaxID=357809 RepID=A9KPV7_LACP7|nr:molybdate ABC transporter substrate-binding protein [Lachnoclostridium phytofermentans]ABX41856.1 molybdenum ABC transporter, periplasmic molybdate-binding protein [Lachnoclostridium phytofermentans ISDg]